jgi:hypothetical protein
MVAATLVTATPAFAISQADCVATAQNGELAIRPGAPIELTPGSGSNAGYFVGGPFTVEVFCRDRTTNSTEYGPVSGEQVKVTASDNTNPDPNGAPTPSGAVFQLSDNINGPTWTPGPTGITLTTDATGHVTFFIRSNSSVVTNASVAITVGRHSEVITNCGNPATQFGCESTNGGAIITTPGATPELSSVALFGSGALGLAGFAFARIRAKRREQDS